MAAKELARQCDAVVVLGAHNSSNSTRLRETVISAGNLHCVQIPSSQAVEWNWLADASTLGIISGASTPESLVWEMVSECRLRYRVEVEELQVATESIEFKLPAMPVFAGH